MANNRLYLYCKVCNEHQYLAKSFGSEWSSSPHDLLYMGEAFVQFMDDHFFCNSSYSLDVALMWELHNDTAKELPLDSKPNSEE